jgi:peptidoglycan hydrolase CwlO-like protein
VLGAIAFAAMDIREARPWFWILIAIVFAVAVVGLVLAISAKDNSVDENQVVKEATAEIKEELDGLNGAIEAADEFQEESDKEAAQDRARIRAAIEEAEAGIENRLTKLGRRVKGLEEETETLTDTNTGQAKEIEKLLEGQETTESELARINQRLRTITADGG